MAARSNHAAAVRLGALAIALFAPTPADALPGQGWAEVRRAAEARGATALPDAVEPGYTYSIGMDGDWRPHGGTSYHAGFDHDVTLGPGLVSVRERFRFTVHNGYLDRRSPAPDATWRAYLRDELPADVAARILDRPAERAFTAALPRPDGDLRRRVLIGAGDGYAYRVEATDRVPTPAAPLRPDRGPVYELLLLPADGLAGLLRDAKSYAIVEPGPTRIGSTAEDLPPGLAAARRPRVAAWRGRPDAGPPAAEPGAAGIGVQLARSPLSLWIRAVAEGGPAAIAGLRADDRVVAIDGADAGLLTEDQAVHAIRGAAGSVVELRVEHADETTQTLRITRKPL